MRAWVAGLALAAAGCASEPAPSEIPYHPTRRDYAAFAAAWPDLYEPNYLPFMVHRAPGDELQGDRLFFCRWEAEDMPLAVHVSLPSIPPALQHEFYPQDPSHYEEAVRRAFETWESELEGRVGFRFVSDPRQARLRVRLLAERAPEPDPDRLVLGETPLEQACQVLGSDPDAERLEVRFRASELRLFLADEFGLLPPDQLEWIALHEIGHALGMRGHSPIPADLMYAVARDRVKVAEGLSIQDVNSFLSLYSLPNGTLFGRVSPDGGGDAAPAPPGPPQLAMAPAVDARHGYELRPPGGWTRLPTAHGMVAVHGVTWDYTASFQIVVYRYDHIEEYLERFAPYYAQRGVASPAASMVVDGRRAIQAEIELFEAPRTEQITLIEVGDGRLLVVIADSPRDLMDAYRPWFAAALATLEIHDLPEEAWPPRRRR